MKIIRHIVGNAIVRNAVENKIVRHVHYPKISRGDGIPFAEITPGFQFVSGDPFKFVSDDDFELTGG